MAVYHTSAHIIYTRNKTKEKMFNEWTNLKQKAAIELCFRNFDVVVDGKERTNKLSREKLTAAEKKNWRKMKQKIHVDFSTVIFQEFLSKQRLCYCLLPLSIQSFDWMCARKQLNESFHLNFFFLFISFIFHE